MSKCDLAAAGDSINAHRKLQLSRLARNLEESIATAQPALHHGRQMIDWTLSKLLHGAVNTALQQHEIGSVAEARVIWKKREIHLDLNLEGEASTVELKALQVEFLEADGHVFVVVGEVKCSRLWIEKAVKNMQPNIKAKLPEKVGKALKMARVVKPQS